MAFWNRSRAERYHLDALIAWELREVDFKVPMLDVILVPLLGFVVSFIHFHERSFAMLPHPFLVRLLQYDKIQLNHLNPNGIQHMPAFVALCEGYWGIVPHFHI